MVDRYVIYNRMVHVLMSSCVLYLSSAVDRRSVDDTNTLLVNCLLVE